MLFRTGNCCGIFGCQFPLLFLDVSYNVALSSIQGCEIRVCWWKMLAWLAALVLITKETWAHLFTRSCLPLGWKSLWKMNWIWISLYRTLLFTILRWCVISSFHYQIMESAISIFYTLVTHKKINCHKLTLIRHRARKKLSRRWSMIQLRDLLNCCFSFFFFFFLFLFFSFFFLPFFFFFTIIEDHTFVA